MRSLLYLLRKEFLHIKRDPFSLRLLIMLPIIQLLILGFALNKDVKHLSYSVFDLDRSNLSRSLIQHSQSMPEYIALRPLAAQLSPSLDLLEAMKKREMSAGLVLPPHFGQDYQIQLREVLAGNSGNPVQVQLLLNGEDANGAALAAGYLSGALQQWSREELEKALRLNGMELGELEPLRTEASFRFNPELISAWFMIPGIAAILVTMVCSLLVSFSLVREKEKGTLEQLLVSPVGMMHILLSKSLPYLLIGFVELFVVLGLGALIFGVPLRADFATLCLFNLLYMIPILGLAILISTLVESQQQALFLVWFCLIFFLLTGGFLLPWENMPQWLKWMTEANPLRFYILILRESLLKGAGIAELWNEALHLLLLGLASYGSALLFFKRKI